MSDYISRQAAINEINKYGSIWMEYTEVMTKDEIAEEALKNAKASMKRIINELPSAQPEIIRCKDCKHRPDTAWFGCPMASSSKWHLDGFCSFAERRTDDR